MPTRRRLTGSGEDMLRAILPPTIADEFIQLVQSGAGVVPPPIFPARLTEAGLEYLTEVLGTEEARRYQAAISRDADQFLRLHEAIMEDAQASRRTPSAEEVRARAQRERELAAARMRRYRQRKREQLLHAQHQPAQDPRDRDISLGGYLP